METQSYYSTLMILGLLQLAAWTQVIVQSEEVQAVSGHLFDKNVTHLGNRAKRELNGHRPLSYAEKYSQYYNGNGIFSDVKVPSTFLETQFSSSHGQHFGHRANRVQMWHQPQKYAEKYKQYYHGNGIFSNVQLPKSDNAVAVRNYNPQLQNSKTTKFHGKGITTKRTKKGSGNIRF